MVNNLYLYVLKEKANNCFKYGMKLSEYTNVIVENRYTSKKGILAFFSPKDTSLYLNENYDILRINILDETLKLFVYDNNNENTNIKLDISNLKDYNLGDYQNPQIIISSSILPENIFKYNKILDVPLLFNTSNELYNNKKEEILYQENLNITYLNNLLNK